MARTTTIRLEPSIEQDLREVAQKQGVSMNALITQSIKEQLDRHAPITPDAYKKLFVASVVKHLHENDQWASEALQDLDVYREGAQVFAGRFRHFSAEKELLAERFIPWLILRILDRIGKGFNVHLVVDSGTTLYFAFRALQRQLIDIAKMNAQIRRLAILTNNIAGVNSYSSISTNQPFCPIGITQPIGLADYVHCNVLGGRLLRQYAALTGPETAEALEHAKQVAKDEADKEGRRCLFIGLLVGQWVRISESASGHPIPLARGYGQKIVKQAMIEKCDEIFLLSPLGKIFHLPEKEIKEGLGGQEGLPKDQQFYEDVPISTDREASSDEEVSVDKERSIKLVTTSRPSEENVLWTHSGKTQALYRSRVVKEGGLNDLVTADIRDLPPFFYAYDKLATRSLAEQIRTEFPHLAEKPTRQFMMDAFSVPVRVQVSTGA